MPLQTIESTRLYRQIAEQISTLSAAASFRRVHAFPQSGKWRCSSACPARRFVRPSSRSSSRAAWKCASAPAFSCSERPCSEAGANRVPLDDDAPGPFDLLAARVLIEGETAALAARNARKAAITALRETIAAMREHEDNAKERDAADRRFHILIAEMTGNSALPLVVTNLWDLRRGESQDSDRGSFPHAGAARQDAHRPRSNRRRARGARRRRRARGDAAPSAPGRTRISAPLGRDRRPRQAN